MRKLSVVSSLLLTGLAIRAAVAFQIPSLASRLSDAKTIVCAHRGRLTEDVPENSLIQMRRTVAAGIPMLELDLAESSDGVIYLLHDKTLDRTTDSSGPIAAHTSDRLDRVHLKRPDKEVTAETLPRFDALLSWASHASVYLLLDIKQTPPSHVAEALKRTGMMSKVIFLTFDDETANRSSAADPALLISVLVDSQLDLDRYMHSSDAKRLIFYIHRKAGIGLMEQARKAGMPVVTDTIDIHDDSAPPPPEIRGLPGSALSSINILVTNQPAVCNKQFAPCARLPGGHLSPR